VDDGFEIILGPSTGPQIPEYPERAGRVYRKVKLRLGKPGAPVRVILEFKALKEMMDHCGSERKLEIGGMLAGKTFRQGDRFVAETRLAIPARQGLSKGTSFTFSHDAWGEINEVLAAAEKASSLLGWYHTHPGFEVFFSGHDRFVHQSFFTQPWQYAIVVDPVGWKIGLFISVGTRVELFDAFEAVCAEEDSDELDQYLQTWFPPPSSTD